MMASSSSANPSPSSPKPDSISIPNSTVPLPPIIPALSGPRVKVTLTPTQFQELEGASCIALLNEYHQSLRKPAPQYVVVAQPIGPDNKSCVDVSLAIGKATFTATAHNKAVAKRQCALTAVAELMRQGESFFREAVKSHFTVVLAQTSSIASKVKQSAPVYTTSTPVPFKFRASVSVLGVEVTSNILYPNRKDAHNNVARIAYEYFKLNNGHDPDHLEDFLAGRPIVISESYFDKKICGVEEEEEESDGDSLVEEDIGNGDDDAANQDGSSSPAAASSEDEDGDGYIPLDGHESVVAAPAATTDDDENEEGAAPTSSISLPSLSTSSSFNLKKKSESSPSSKHLENTPGISKKKRKLAMLADGESLPIYSSPSGGVGAGSLGPRIMARLEDLVETALNGIPLRVNTRSVSLQTPATGPSSKSNSGDAGGDQQSNNTSTAACATPTNSLVALATADPSLPTEGWMAQIIVGAMEFRSPRMRPTKAMAIESAAVVAYRSLMEKLDRVHEIPPEFAGVDEVEDGEVEWQEEPSGSVSTMENNMSIVSSLFYNKKLPLTIAKSPAPSSSAAAAKGASSIEGGSTRPLSHKTPRQERTQLIKQHQHGNGGGSFANNNNNNYNNNSSKRFKHDHQNDSYKYYPPPPSNNRYGNNNTNNAMAGTRQSVPPPVQYTCNICNQKGHWIKDCALYQGGNNRNFNNSSNGAPRPPYQKSQHGSAPPHRGSMGPPQFYNDGNYSQPPPHHRDGHHQQHQHRFPPPAQPFEQMPPAYLAPYPIGAPSHPLPGAPPIATAGPGYSAPQYQHPMHQQHQYPPPAQPYMQPEYGASPAAAPYQHYQQYQVPYMPQHQGQLQVPPPPPVPAGGFRTPYRPSSQGRRGPHPQQQQHQSPNLQQQQQQQHQLNYTSMVADLASRKKWPVPEYTIMADASSTGYSCTAVVNGRVFKTFKTHPSPAAAQEDVAGDIFKANSN